jgi:hypothetical protein
MNKQEQQPIITYKAFDKDFKCRGFQYEVGKEYETDKPISICEQGFHACENPFEIWDYYDLTTSRFAVVEQSGNIAREDEQKSTKICSSKIKIKAELKLADIIKLGIEWIKGKTSMPKIKDTDLRDNNGDYAKIGSSGDYAKIGSSGDYAKIGSSGDYAKIGSSGDYAKIGSSGDYAKIGSSGYSAQIGSSGYSAQIGSSGYSAQIGSSGYSAQIGSSGDYAKINSMGEDSVICCAGYNARAKAKKGSWITLAEWVYNDDKKRYVPTCVKTEFVDGKRIKADTWYKIENGEFVIDKSL